MKKINTLIATVFGIGYLPVAPGTWGSLAGLGICYLFHQNMIVYLSFFATSFIFGTIASDKVEKYTDSKDPSFVVIDEFACIFLVYLFVPMNAFTMIAGFILYRVIDIIKVTPMRQLEKINGGWGIMLDDLVCGIYANLILQVVLFLKK